MGLPLPREGPPGQKFHTRNTKLASSCRVSSSRTPGNRACGFPYLISTGWGPCRRRLRFRFFLLGFLLFGFLVVGFDRGLCCRLCFGLLLCCIFFFDERFLFLGEIAAGSDIGPAVEIDAAINERLL